MDYEWDRDVLMKIDPIRTVITSHTYSVIEVLRTVLIVNWQRKIRMKSIYKAIPGGTLRKRDLTWVKSQRS